MRRAVCALLWLVPLRAASQDTQAWKLSGYYLNLLTRSTTVFPEGERYVLDLNRLRLRLDGKPHSAVSLQLQYDNEAFLGSYLSTGQFALTKDRVPDASLDLERKYVDRRSMLIRHRVYRATMTWSGKDTDVTIGRQRIAWGTGRFWSPLDVLNPFDAARIEREERPGVDALLVDRKLGPLGKLNGVFAPATDRSPAAIAAYLHGNARGTDYSVLVGKLRNERVVGADMSGRFGGLGIRAEATASQPDAGRRFIRALLGADYGFANTLTVTGEFYFNGQGNSNRARYDFIGLFEGRIRSLARRYGAVAASYEITPLLEVFFYGILNGDDRSRVLWPGLEYSATSDLALTAGIQSFSGTAGSEYGRFQDVVHLQAKLFF